MERRAAGQAPARGRLGAIRSSNGSGSPPGVNDFFGGHYFWGAASTAAKAAAFDAAIAVQPVARRRILQKA